MIRTCEGYEERWTQAARSAIVKSERASHREENESGDDESGMEKTRMTIRWRVTLALERQTSWPIFITFLQPFLTATVIKTRMVVPFLLE